MKKNTKLITVASAAALLAIGASMTSFAATGWTEENGEWFYYDNDGNRVEDEWKKSGDNWYWLDSESNGAMATDKLIDDNDNTYYVDTNGVMVKNTWIKMTNEDQDDEDDPAEYNYYYMQSNGKAYKAGDSGKVKKKTIDGKTYSFDEDGKMLYGWVSADNADRLSGDTDWSDATGDVYYFGNWDDGSMKTGWQKISVYDDDEDEDCDYWFNFKSNGVAIKDNTDKKINGKHYSFDERGVMVSQWYLATGANSASVSNWKYFNSPEDGARVTKGWFKVVAANEDNTFNADFDDTDSFDYDNATDEEEKWYYADGDGELYAGEIKKIKGKNYAFAPEGYMLSGLVFMDVDGSGKITTVYDDDVDSDELDDIMDDKADGCGTGATLYYFGDEDSDGAAKTGATTINLDGDNYQFFFEKSGGVEKKGRGMTGIDDSKYIYKYGKKIKAETDDKYILVEATGTTSDDSATVTELDTADYRKNAETSEKNKDGDVVKYVTGFEDDIYLVNTSGQIVKSKSAAKDGDDWYFYVDNKHVKMYTNDKTLPDSLKDWKN